MCIRLLNVISVVLMALTYGIILSSGSLWFLINDVSLQSVINVGDFCWQTNCVPIEKSSEIYEGVVRYVEPLERTLVTTTGVINSDMP